MGTVNNKYTILDNYKQTPLDIFYDRDIPEYPKHARRALPILIERAKEERYIGYTKLADLLDIHHAYRGVYIGNYVCACISTTLYRFEKEKKEKLPRLTNIVITRESLGNEKNYVVIRFKRLGYQPTWKNYKCQLLTPIYAYGQWDKVLDWLSITTE